MIPVPAPELMSRPSRAPVLVITALAALLLAAAPALGGVAGAQAATGPQNAAVPADGAVAAADTRPVRRSWTSSRRDLVVGDVVTILVDEYTLASANKDYTAVDYKRRNASVKVETPGDAAAPMGGGFNTRNDGESTQHGATSRQNRFRSEISVRVMEIDAHGLARVEGTKLVDVDKNRQEVAFKGWVRPQDLSSLNQVESWKVADASLVYTAKGSLGKPRGGMIGRVIGAIWP
jgi:flagellar L-ring protein precursor FlgH